MPKRKATAEPAEPAKSAKKAAAKNSASKKSAPSEKAAAAPSSGTPSGAGLISLIKDPKWRDALISEESQPYFANLEKLVLADYSDKSKEVFPPKDLIFNAFNLTPLDKVKAVIIGQDPYHDNGQAHGLSFSVPRGIKPPPSLKNIYKELQLENKSFKIPDHGCLEEWAKRGVLLLNATLTVEAHKPNSHAKYGWQTFTDSVIRAINANTSGVVFILWGGFAQKKSKLVDSTKHSVVESAHPSPLSVSKFLNCNCFKNANDKLKKMGKEPVDWSLS